MKKSLSLFIILAMLIGLTSIFYSNAFSTQNQVKAVAPPIVGAVRWDAWLPKTNSVGAQVARSLGPNKYHFRLPYFAICNGDNDVDFPTPSQAIVDAEIQYAKYAGLTYWAYVYYEDSGVNSNGTLKVGMDNALDLHLSSSHTNDMNWCYIVEQGRLTSANIPQMVTRMKLSNYQTVAGGHPLFYLFSSGSWTAAQVNLLKTAVANAGLPTLYLVYMGGASTMAATLGCSAVSSYCTGGTSDQTYAKLASNEVSNWNSWKSSGYKVIPIVTTGWDNRPRIDNPVSWTTPGANSWVPTATTAEIANHLNEALSWTASNQTTDESNAILMYAWNEHDEGGWICPTVKVDATGNALKDSQGKNQINEDRIDAIHNILNSGASITPYPWGTNSPTATNKNNTPIPGVTMPPTFTASPFPGVTMPLSATDTPQPDANATNTIENTDTSAPNNTDIQGSPAPEKTLPNSAFETSAPSNQSGNSKLWLPIAGSVVVLLCGGGVTTILILKKKK